MWASTLPPRRLSPQGLRKGSLATTVTVFWKQPCHVRFLVTAPHLPGEDNRPGACGSGARESSSVDGFSTTPRSSWLQQPLFRAHPSLQQAHQLPKASSDPTPSGSKVFNGFQVTSGFKLILMHLEHSPHLTPAQFSNLLSHVPFCLFAKTNELYSCHMPTCALKQEALPLHYGLKLSLFQVILKCHHLHEALP